MRTFIAILTIALAVACNAQQAYKGDVSNNSLIVTNEQDLAAMRTLHYGSQSIHESPAAWFQTDGAGTITNFLYQSGREAVVIPWTLDGVPVKSIGASVFTVYDGNQDEYIGKPITSITTPLCLANISAYAFRQCDSLTSVSLPAVKTIGPAAFFGCSTLTSVTLPATTLIRYDCFAACGLRQVTLPAIETIEEYAFSGLSALTAVYFSGNAPAIGTDIYDSSTSVTNYVTSPTATGWTATLNGRPVVHPGVTASSLTVGGTNVMGEIANSVQKTGGTMTGTLSLSPSFGAGAFASVTSEYGFYGLATTGYGFYGYSASGGGAILRSGSGTGVIASSTTGKAAFFNDSNGNSVTVADHTNALVVVGNVSISGAVLIGGTNVITELAGKAAASELVSKYDASNPNGYVNAETTTNIARNVEGWITYSNLTGSVTLTNQFEAPIAISGTGAVSVAFSGLRTPHPVYFTAHSFSSITFPAGTYLVGGGMWQTNRVNHFLVWQYSTNLYVNPLISTEL
jgi:hypothetical protein